MSLLRVRLFLLLFLLPGLLAAAPGAVKKGAVGAELVAREASIKPGRAFLVALKLNHDEHWHSYWVNAGTGYPTSLDWKLPEGFTAGPIIWPTPHVVKDTKGIVTGHGYEGEVFLFTEITPPATIAPGTDLILRAKADWLMCKDVCMPGDAELELTLPVSADAPRENMSIARLFNNAYADLPKPLAGWAVTASRKDSTFAVRLTPAPGTTHRPQDLHLFDSAGLVDYAAPQQVAEEKGSLVLTLSAAKDGPADATRLAGVLSSANGWGPTIAGHGATFDVELGSAASTAAIATKNSEPPTKNPPPAAAGLLGTLLLAFVGGLILNLMPCVFPVLGIKVLGFVNQAGSDRRKVIAHGLVYTFGVLLSFWTLAGVILALRATGQEIGWGAQLQVPGFVFGMAVFLLIFSLNLSGLFEVGLSATAVGGKLQMKQGYSGSFFSGILAVLVSTPCSAPFLAPALGAAFSSAFSAGESMLIFTLIAIGLASPYLLLSLFPAAVKLLPRPGAWMETFKQLMAFPLYASVGWLLWVLAAQTKDDDYAFLLIVFALVIIAMAAWIYGRWAKPAARLAAAALLVGALWFGWPKTAEATPAANAGYAVKWEHWSPAALEAARTAGRTVYVDFTARWCATCQTNKAAVFTSAAVLAELEKRNVLLLKADWTSKDPAITAELAKWNRSAVPFNLIYAPGRPEPTVLPELLTPGTVLEALATTK
jgi:thiol:disulfide interchange protein/DsbC/DsbD-like thiol-disulfide interchange protein